MPEAAKCTADEDIVLLSTWPSYRAQLVHLGACEKGLKWRFFLVDIHKERTQI